jgi:tetratricopeptide (TPR) repeat protein
MDEYDYIGNYFNGLLSQEEMKRFDEKIQQDPAFAEDVAFYCSSLQQIKNQLVEEKKTRFRELYELQGLDKRSKPPEVYMNKWWKVVAAAVVLIAITGTYIYSRPSSPKALAETYLTEELTILPVDMDTRQDSMKTGIRLYNEKKYPQALQVFENILRADTSGTDAKKYAGIVSLRLGDYDKALKYFGELESYTELQVNPGKFYHAITLMERNHSGDKDLARQLLEEVDKYNLAGKKRAIEWLRKL